MTNIYPMKRTSSRLADEIQQTRPFQSPAQEAFLALLRTTDLLRRTSEKLLEPHDITSQQYNVLRILRGAGRAGLPTLAIAERMVERSPGITRLIDRLEARGLVERTRSEEDRRQVYCTISAGGLAVLAAVDAEVAGMDDELLSMLTADEQEQLIDLLDRIRAGLR